MTEQLSSSKSQGNVRLDNDIFNDGDNMGEGQFSSKLFLIVALVIFGLFQLTLSDYIVDDTFIHLTFARNLTTGHGFAFNPDQPTNGVTAPLWTILLALFSALFTIGPGLAKTLSIVSGALTIPAFRSLSRRCGLSGNYANFALLVWAANVWLARWSASGMEASFAVLLVIMSFDAHLSGKHKLSAVLLGLLVLTRPEAVVLILVFSIDNYLRGVRKIAWQSILLSALPILIWFGYALQNFGTIVPNPALIKSDAILPPIRDVWLGIKRTSGILFGGNGIEIFLLFVGSAMILSSKPISSSKARLFGLLLFWSLFPAFTYISRGVFVQSRYLLIGIPPLVIGGFLGLKMAIENWNEFVQRRVLYSITFVLLLQQVAMTQFVTLPHIAAFKPTISALVKISELINREAPPDALVAVGDVGIVGFNCGRRVLDLEGLVSAEIIPFRLGISLDEFILSGSFFKAGRPDYFIDKSRDPRRLENRWNAEVVEVFPIPGGLVDTADESWYYTLYHLDRQTLTRTVD